MARLDDYIRHLQELQELVGPAAEVEKWMPAKGRHTAPLPKIAYARQYPARRGGDVPVQQFWNPEHDSEAQKGHVVVRV